MPSTHTARHTTPPNNTLRVVHPTSVRQRSPAVSPTSPSSASSGSVRTPNDNSPNTLIKHHPPTLLPKIRKQDQILDPNTYYATHQRLPSLASAGYPFPRLAPLYDQPTRASTPPEYSLPTPVSATSRYTVNSDCSRPSVDTHSCPPRQYSSAHSRSASVPFAGGHTYAGSQHSFAHSDPPQHLYHPNSTAQHYTQPYYPSTHQRYWNQSQHRQLPRPIHVSTNSDTTYPLTPSQHSPLPPDLLFESYGNQTPPTTTLLEYLTSLNPCPSIVRQATPPDRLNDAHYWWDIRNSKSSLSHWMIHVC